MKFILAFCLEMKYILFMGIPLVLAVSVLSTGNDVNSLFDSYNVSSLHCGEDIRAIDLRGVGIPISCPVPEPLYVGDNFTVNAVVFNYSPDTIKIAGASPSCSNPLSVVFDKNVEIIPGPVFIRCEPSTPHMVNSGQVIDLSPVPANGIGSFTATSFGKVNATFSLAYSELRDNSTMPRTLNGSFTFTILQEGS